MKTKLFQFMQNTIAYALPVFLQQFIVYPIMAKKLGSEENGLFLSLLALNYFVTNITATVLVNTRLLQNEKYQEKKEIGDYNVLLVIFAILNSIFIGIGTYLYSAKHVTKIQIILSIVLVLLFLYHDYITVQYRIELRFDKILINNLILCIGYLVGLMVFFYRGLYWQTVFLIPYFMTFLYDMKNTNYIFDPICITSIFRDTTKQYFILMGSTLLTTAVTYGDRLILYPLMDGNSVSIFTAAQLIGKMPFKSDKTVDEDYFILTLFALALEAKSRSITLSGKDIVLGVGLPPADFGQQAQGFKRYFMEHAKHGISFKFNGKAVNCYLKDTFVSPQNFAAVMCYKASLFKQYRTVNCIDIGDGTVDLLVIRKGQPDLSVRVSDRSGMAILRSEISNVIQQNFGIHLESSDVEQVLMQEATILDEEIVCEIQKMAKDWMQRIINKLHAYVPDFRTNPTIFLGGGSLLLKPQIEKSSDFKYIEFIEDVRANAVGYEKLTAMRL